MAAEEQQNELDTLQAIYLDEFTKLEDSPTKFEIVVQGSNEIDDALPTIKLEITYTENYPSEITHLINQAPLIDILTDEVVTDKQAAAMKQALDSLAVESVGMVMVFTLVSAAKDWLDENIKQAPKEVEIAKINLEEVKITHREGIPVTPESFAVWRKKFDEEMGVLKTNDKSKKSLTGKQLFEADASLAGSDAAFGDELDELKSSTEQLVL